MKKRLHVIKLRLQRLWWLIGLVSVLSTAGAVVMQKMDLFGVEGQELGAYDGGLTFWTRRPTLSKDLILLGIDEATIQEIGHNAYLAAEYNASWPYKRKLWQVVLPYLAQQGAKAIVIDALMPQSGADGIDFQNALKATSVPVYIAFDFNPAQEELPHVVPEPNKPVYAPDFSPTQPAGPEETFEAQPTSVEERSPAQHHMWKEAAVKTTAFPVVFQGMASNTSEQYPLPPLEEAWGYSRPGLAHTEADEDGKMRRVRFGYCDPAKNCYVSLAIRVVADLYKADRVHIAPGKLTVGVHNWKINHDGSAWLHYGGNWTKRFESISLIHALRDGLNLRDKLNQPLRIPAGTFRDKVVVVAGIAAATGDTKATPFTGMGPGAIKHAAELENLLHTGFIIDAPYWISVLIGFFLALISILVVLIIDSALIELVWPLVVFFGFYVVPGYFLVKYQIHILSIMPALAGSFASVLASVYKNFLAEKDREEMRELFSKYMEKDVVDVMVEQHQLPSLRGEERELTVFVSTVDHFSERVSYLPTSERMNLLNQYLSVLTKILVEEGACIDKYVGEDVRAFFNAPIAHTDHALRAARAALRIQQACTELNQHFQARGWPILSTHIALITDVLWVGNMGTAQLIDYTAMGKGMDIAVLLKTWAVTHQTPIVLESTAYNQIQTHVKAREIAQFPLPSEKQTLVLYELQALHPSTEKKNK